MEMTITCGGKDVKLKASALVPRLYRYKFRRDMIQDMRKLVSAYNKVRDLPEDATEEQRQGAQFTVLDLEVFENVAYIMAKHADPKAVPSDPNEWLDSFPGVFSIYEVLPAIVQLWNAGAATTSVSKKN